MHRVYDLHLVNYIEICYNIESKLITGFALRVMPVFSVQARGMAEP